MVNQIRRNGSFAPLSEDILPLDQLPLDTQEAIAWAVAQPDPPDRWLPVGDPLSPIALLPSRAWFEWHWARGKTPGSRPNRPHIDPELRAAVYERDGHVCAHCGSRADLSLDHIHPWSLGGEDSLSNLQTLCRSCNSKKGVGV